MSSAQATGAGESRTPVPLRRNRLHWFAGRTHEVLDGLDRPATWALSVHERGETVAELVALRSRIDAQLATTRLVSTARALEPRRQDHPGQR